MWYRRAAAHPKNNHPPPAHRATEESVIVHPISNSVHGLDRVAYSQYLVPILVPKLFTRKTNRSFVAVQYTVPRVRHSNVAHCTRITNLSKQGSHLGPSGITFRCLDSYPQAHQSVNPTCQGGSEICRLEPSRPLSSERIDGPALTTAIVTPQVPSGRT